MKIAKKLSNNEQILNDYLNNKNGSPLTNDPRPDYRPLGGKKFGSDVAEQKYHQRYEDQLRDSIKNGRISDTDIERWTSVCCCSYRGLVVNCYIQHKRTNIIETIGTTCYQYWNKYCFKCDKVCDDTRKGEYGRVCKSCKVILNEEQTRKGDFGIDFGKYKHIRAKDLTDDYYIRWVLKTIPKNGEMKRLQKYLQHRARL